MDCQFFVSYRPLKQKIMIFQVFVRFASEQTELTEDETNKAPKKIAKRILDSLSLAPSRSRNAETVV